MWKALEAVAKTSNKPISIFFKPRKGAYNSKYSDKWRIELMATTFADVDPLKAISEAVKFFARAYGIDIEKELNASGSDTGK